MTTLHDRVAALRRRIIYLAESPTPAQIQALRSMLEEDLTVAYRAGLGGEIAKLGLGATGLLAPEIRVSLAARADVASRSITSTLSRQQQAAVEGGADAATWRQGAADWKAPMIYGYEAGLASYRAQRDFYRENGHLDGLARLVPETGSCDRCLELVSAGWVSLADALETDAPLHPSCLHSWDIDPAEPADEGEDAVPGGTSYDSAPVPQTVADMRTIDPAEVADVRNPSRSVLASTLWAAGLTIQLLGGGTS